MTQEHIPDPRDRFICEVRSAIESDTKSGVSARRIVTTIKDSLAALVVAPDPEYIPSKPGAEAAAPLDALDWDLIDNLEFMVRDGEDLKGDSSRLVGAKLALLSRLSSLRESVASLTADRNKALIVLGKASFEIKELKAERDAMRLALETWKRAEVLRDRFDEDPTDDEMGAAEEVQSLYDEAYALRNAALIDARNSSKEAQP